MIVASGSFDPGSRARWGNYSSMDVDPVEPCTFWFTSEYYDATTAAGWKTRIVSFQAPTCDGEEEEDDGCWFWNLFN